MASSNFSRKRELFELEGVYVGGWSLKHVLMPSKRDRLQRSAENDDGEKILVEQDWTKEEETKLRRKLDMRVLLPCCVVFFLALLDRGNLGNIKILQQGTPDSLDSSLHLHGRQFNWAVSMPSFAVTALLLPSNLLMKKISAKRYFPLIMLLWGTIVMSFAALKNSPEFLSGRFMLGIPEAGVVTCCIMYFSFWYKPSERAFRVAVFCSAGSLASAVSGFLALAINNLNRKGGLKSWQWVFIIEGALPILMAPVLWLWLLTYPEESTALSDRERYIAINRFGPGSTRRTDVTWSWLAFRRIFTRPSTYIFFTSYISLSIVASAQGTFLPTFLSKFLRFSTAKSNLYTAICKLTIIPIYCFYGAHSDWTHERMWHYIIPALIAVPRYSVWTYAASHPAHSISNISLYGLSFLGQMIQIAQPILVSYRTATLYGACEQAVGGAAVVASGSIAGIIAPHLYPDRDSPRFLPGFSTTCGLLVICIGSYLSLPFWLEFEAAMRKEKTGHALPMQALQDAEHAQISEAGRARIRTLNGQEDAVNAEEGDSIEKDGTTTQKDRVTAGQGRTEPSPTR